MPVVFGLSLMLAGSPQAAHENTSPSAGEPARLPELRSRAYNLYLAGQFTAAAELYTQAYQLALSASPSLAAFFLMNAGSAEFAMYHYTSALDAYLRAKQLAEKSGDSENFALICSNLSSLYLQIGALEDADEAAERALRAAEKTNAFAFQAQLLAQLGTIQAFRGNLPATVRYFREAINAAAETDNQSLLALVLYKCGEELLRLHQTAQAEPYLVEAFRLRKLFKDRDLRASYLTVAQLRMAQHDLHAASALLHAALELPSAGVGPPLWTAFHFEGRILMAQGRIAAAVTSFRAALQAADDWREEAVPSDLSRIGADARVHELYRDFIETSLELPNPPIAEAFLAAEEDHAASLRHALRLEQGARNGTIPDPAYGEKLAQMRSAEQFAVVKNTSEGRASLSRLNLELDEIEAKYRLRTFAVKRRETQNSRHGTELAQFQSALATGEALLSFYQGEQSLYLWALTRNRFEFHTLRYGYRLSQLAPRFASSVLSQANDRDKIGQELFQNLFGQLSPEIRNQPRWLIAADDDLFRIPFAALTVRKAGNTNVYLAQEHSVIQIPSASILPASEQAPIDGRFVGIGDGIYNTADPRWPGHSNMWRRSSIPRTLPRLQLARLIASGHEIESCAHIWGENSPILLTGIQGSREGLETALTEPSLAIIHIAAHFIYPQNQPDRPVIDLGLNRSSESDVLTIQDVANMHVPSALVVMSGCSSAASKSVPGVGVMGMGRAWLMAGALVVVGSRWPTPDDSGDLFQSFYRHLRTLRKLGSTRAVAEAMRAAQTEMLSSNTWRSDPSYWAAFYVLGKD